VKTKVPLIFDQLQMRSLLVYYFIFYKRLWMGGLCWVGHKYWA